MLTAAERGKTSNRVSAPNFRGGPEVENVIWASITHCIRDKAHQITKKEWTLNWVERLYGHIIMDSILKIKKKKIIITFLSF